MLSSEISGMLYTRLNSGESISSGPLGADLTTLQFQAVNECRLLSQ